MSPQFGDHDHGWSSGRTPEGMKAAREKVCSWQAAEDEPTGPNLLEMHDSGPSGKRLI
jgi:hypothetical protein